MMNEVQSILLIGGSDSSGGAGIQADCAVARACNVMPVCAVSCITSQGVGGLKMIMPVDEKIFSSQLSTAFEELHPAGVKIGMIPEEKLIDILIDKLALYHPANVVLDPVMAPTSGRQDICDEMWRNKSLYLRIAPFLDLITPNIPEGLKIVDAQCEITTEESLKKLATCIKSQCDFKGVLLKGGHLVSEILVDCLCSGDEGNLTLFHHPAVNTRNTHGTGCALATSIVCNLIKGVPLATACNNAIDTLYKSLVGNKNTVFFSNPAAAGPAFFEI